MIYLVIFIMGIIFGMLFCINWKAQKILDKLGDAIKEGGWRVSETQFIEPISFKERFDNSKTVDDILEK